MLLKSDWTEQFVKRCASIRSARRKSLSDGQSIYLEVPKGRCWVIATGYVKLVDSSGDGNRSTKLIVGRGSLFGDRPFGDKAFHGFAAQLPEQAMAHGAASVIELDREALCKFTLNTPEFASMMIELLSTRIEFLERRLTWSSQKPLRVRMASALRDLICFEGQRCRHGHSIDVRLTHSDLSELVDAARPVVSAELVQMRKQGVISYTKSYFCVDNLTKLNQIAGRKS
jgi:CRP/FNR family transcriptional regulator, cyclic AMP receptor protein